MAELREAISREPFLTVGRVADRLERKAYVVGGYVRDLLLGRKSKDIDFVTVGSGIELAEAIASEKKHARLTVFRNFGTAQVLLKGMELEFVGARKESYNRGSRKPIVEDGTLEDDLSRRDFTINALALCVNSGDCFGEVVDMFGGIDDLNKGLIRTPLDPDITFSDDPLRMLRAVRFAARLDFRIVPETMEAIRRNASRLEIISRERVADELCKMMLAEKPSRAWMLLSESGLLPLVLPELDAMKGVETVKGRGHKDNFLHTLEVLDNVAAKSDSLWLRWAALLHDIAKPVTKRWDMKQGWTFHNHNFIGGRMVPKIFRSLKLPLNEKMKYVQKLVELHMRPIALVEEEVTDSAVRRLLFDAGEDIEDLMTLCEADITSKNAEKVRRLLQNFQLVREKMKDLEERDHIRTFQPPVDGHEIMATFGMQSTDPPDRLKIVGELKNYVKEAILDGRIHNDHDEARALMLERAAELGLKAV
ncbi:MAG: CCA tRNA nucleotidyltransferase [Muribaculaceae bacterium]|nr:CCA tRNA nucleotidyltransferase [Muribaculaceae bacterium]